MVTLEFFLTINIQTRKHCRNISINQQLFVDEDAPDTQTIITQKGDFRPNLWQFGVCTPPGILIEDLLSGLPGVVPYFEDVLIGADCKQSLALQLQLEMFS